MNGIPMKFDFSKTLNEQQSTFDYYKDRYISYELELIRDRKEIERLKNIIKDIKSQLDYLETYSSKEDVFEDMKRRLDKIENIVNRG